MSCWQLLFWSLVVLSPCSPQQHEDAFGKENSISYLSTPFLCICLLIALAKWGYQWCHVDFYWVHMPRSIDHKVVCTWAIKYKAIVNSFVLHCVSLFVSYLHSWPQLKQCFSLVYHRSLSPRKLNFFCCNFRIIVMAYAPLHRSWNSVLIKPWSWKTFLWGLNFLVMLPLPMLFSSLYTHS